MRPATPAIDKALLFQWLNTQVTKERSFLYVVVVKRFLDALRCQLQSYATHDI